MNPWRPRRTIAQTVGAVLGWISVFVSGALTLIGVAALLGGIAWLGQETSGHPSEPYAGLGGVFLAGFGVVGLVLAVPALVILLVLALLIQGRQRAAMIVHTVLAWLPALYACGMTVLRLAGSSRDAGDLLWLLVSAVVLLPVPILATWCCAAWEGPPARV